MYKKLNKIHENLIPTKLITKLIPYNTIEYNKIQTISYNTMKQKYTLYLACYKTQNGNENGTKQNEIETACACMTVDF